MSGKRAAGSDKPSSSGRIRQTFYASPCHVAGPSEEPNTAADIGQRTSDAMPLAAENVGMPTPAFLQQRLSKRYGPDWQPNKPKDKGKQLTEVLSHVTHDMHWRRLQTIAEYAPPDAMFANMNWKQILDTVWLEAHTCAGGIAMMQGNPTAPAMSRGQSSSDAPVESVRVSVVNCPEWSVDAWHKAVCNSKLESLDGLYQYLQRWSISDKHVRDCMNGDQPVPTATAGLGGWLADYVYTRFLVLTERARPTIQFVVVANKLYADLWGRLSETHRSAGQAGNTLEHLCWHAHEHSRSEFILAVVWHVSPTTITDQANGALLQENAAALVEPPLALPQGQSQDETQSDEMPVEAAHLTADENIVVTSLVAVSEPYHVTEQVHRDNQSNRPVNIKKDILAPLNAACKWDADTNSWILPNTPEQPLTICRNWKNALGDKYPRGADVTGCLPTFFLEEADANQHGAPRLDLVLSFSNGDTVRYHPGATPISSRDPQPTDAMQARINLRRKLQAQS